LNVAYLTGLSVDADLLALLSASGTVFLLSLGTDLIAIDFVFNDIRTPWSTADRLTAS
jgi:hypothetical protein